MNGGKSFLWLSERDGFRHLYLYSIDGREVKQLTKGPWEVTGIAGVNDADGTFFCLPGSPTPNGTPLRPHVFYISSEPSPLERHLYSIGLDGSEKRQLTQGAGTHNISMGPASGFYVDRYSSITSPPRSTIHSSDGREVAVYRDADRGPMTSTISCRSRL